MKDQLLNSYFFAGKKSGAKIKSKILNKISLSDIDFNIRFSDCIRFQSQLKNLTDLLNTDYKYFLMHHRNCGKKTIEYARNIISELIDKGIENGFETISPKDKDIKVRFLKNIKFDLPVNFDEILNLKLIELIFEISFLKNLEKTPSLVTVRDLLKTDPDVFRSKVNCSEITIKRAQKLLRDLLNGRLKISPPNIKFIHELLTDKDNIDVYSENEKLLNSESKDLRNKKGIDISKFFFPKVNTVRELLSTSPNFYLHYRNIGRGRIKIAQQYLIDLFAGKYDIVLSDENDIVGNILIYFRSYIENERDLNIFLEYNNFNDSGKITYDQIGSHYGISRERVRQIIITTSRTINRHKHIFSDLIKRIKSFGYIYDMKDFLTYLINNNLCKKENIKFIEKMIKTFLNYRYDISLNGKYVMTVNPEILTSAINSVSEFISGNIKDLQNGFDIQELLILLKRNMIISNELDPDKLFTADILAFILEENKNYYISGNKLYSIMEALKLS